MLRYLLVLLLIPTISYGYQSNHLRLEQTYTLLESNRARTICHKREEFFNQYLNSVLERPCFIFNGLDELLINPYVENYNSMSIHGLLYQYINQTDIINNIILRHLDL